MKAKCRHNTTWLMDGGTWEWCYGCGAWRRMRETGIAQCAPMSPWCVPVGVGGENPWCAWDRRRTSWSKREETRVKKPLPAICVGCKVKMPYRGLCGECACEQDSL